MAPGASEQDLLDQWLGSLMHARALRERGWGSRRVWVYEPGLVEEHG